MVFNASRADHHSSFFTTELVFMILDDDIDPSPFAGSGVRDFSKKLTAEA